MNIILYHVFEQLEREGFDVTYLDVSSTGAIDLDQLEETITDKTILVSIMFVNNEVGTVQQIYDIQDIIAQQMHISMLMRFKQLDILMLSLIN